GTLFPHRGAGEPMMVRSRLDQPRASRAARSRRRRALAARIARLAKYARYTAVTHAYAAWYQLVVSGVIGLAPPRRPQPRAASRVYSASRPARRKATRTRATR